MLLASGSETVALSLSLSPSLQFCLGNKPWQPCYVMRMNHTTIMLDCSLDLPVLLNFLPLPLVYRSILILPCHVRLVVMYVCNSPKLSGLPRWQCKDPSIAVDLPEDIARLVYYALLEHLQCIFSQ